MAARLNPSHDERTRDKIKTSQLINRLMQLVNGEVEMPAHAVSAALGLLRKTLPDLSATDHTTKGEKLTHVQWLDHPEELQPSHTGQGHSSKTSTNGTNGGHV